MSGLQAQQQEEAAATSQERRRPVVEEEKEISLRPLYRFLGLLLLDSVTSALFLLPIFRPVEQWENVDPRHPLQFTLYGSLWDVAVLALFRVLAALAASVLAYYYPTKTDEDSEEHDDDNDNEALYHPNGIRKTKEELEQEALEEGFGPKLMRYVQRYSFGLELLVLITGIWISIKSMARLNVEIGIYDEAKPEHPLFWLALAMTCLWCLLECIFMNSIETLVSKIAAAKQKEEQAGNSRNRTNTGTSLTEPLLQSTTPNNNNNNNSDGNENPEGDSSNENSSRSNRNDDNMLVKHEIGNSNYKASWAEILDFVMPDKHWIFLATIFLFVAAVCNVYIPHFTGKILDDLVDNARNNTTGNDNDDHHGGGGSLLDLPGFLSNIEMLVLVSILGGVFSGVRGAIFSTVGARCNARLRIELMDSLLCQEIGFFDTTRTGDITSRLSSDTTLVGAAITNNVNVFLRSIVRAMGVLIFMAFISWQLTLLAFLTIPAVSILSRWYGRYIRKLSKAQQKKLADGNNVSECVLSSMPTVRAFGAERIELKEFEKCMENFLQFQKRSALATFGYQTFVGALPQLVKALVLFYGGLLVQSDRNSMTGGQLITFILYLSTLAESFSSLGGVYASLTRAMGAADKVFELMNRKPKRAFPPGRDGTCVAATEEVDDDDDDDEHSNDIAECSEDVDIEQQQSTETTEEGDTGSSEPSTDNHNDCESDVFAEASTDRAQSLLSRLCHAGGRKQRRVAGYFFRGLHPAGSLSCLQGGGEITFHNVEARYPARPQRQVLDGLNLTIPAGSVVALVGSSGSGKSSIAKLIQNLYEPTSGKVCIDGVDVRHISPEWLTRHVSVVDQSCTLFARSVKRNIIYGLEENGQESSNVSDEEIYDAARKSNADTFINRLPHGYETEVGERGIQLSGGQKQRVAIARALVRSPSILILDEATSALDSESEHSVQTAIDDMIAERREIASYKTRAMTVLMIAHRLSTVRRADIIFVIENGRVVEQGSHDELLSKEDGVYNALVRRQLNPR